MKKADLKIAHLSDLHFAHATFTLDQFFSKRWLGNLNLILFRNKTMRTTPLMSLPELFQKIEIDHVLITGDVATTSLTQEFELAKAFVQALENRGLQVHLIPGNHDVYTRGSDKTKRFYQYFPGLGKDNRVEARRLADKWWWVGLDTAIATPLWLSNGLFSSSMAKGLENTLKAIPKGDKVILANHFPLFGTGHPRHDLKGREGLQHIIQKYPCVALYLHGHDHIPYTIDRTKEGFPIVSNSGSCSDAPERSFSTLELTNAELSHTRYIFKESWEPTLEKTYSLQREKKYE